MLWDRKASFLLGSHPQWGLPMLYLKWLCRKCTSCVLYLHVDASAGIQDWGKSRLTHVKGHGRNWITALCFQLRMLILSFTRMDCVLGLSKYDYN